MDDLSVDQQNLLWQMVSARVSKLKRSRGDEYTGCCPAHDDANPSWGINMLTGLHNCHSCSFGGNAVVLAKHWNLDPKPFYSADYQSGTGSLVEKVSVVVKPPDDPHEKQEKPPLNLPSYDKIEDWDLVPLPEEKVRQNWDMDAVSELQVFWSKKYRGLAFLVLDLDYNFVGAYLHKPEVGNTRFTVGVKSQVYPQFVLKNYSQKKPLIIVEGLPDVITARSWGFQAVSGTAGAGSVPKDLSPYEPWSHPATRNKQYMGTNESTVWPVSNPVILPFDFDKSGREGANKLAKALKMRFPDMVVLVCDWRKLRKKYKAGADITDIEHSDFIKLIETADEWRLTKIGRFKVMRGAEYQDLEPEPLEFIIEHLLPLNFNSLLGGETGASKSYFSMQKAMCIASNEDSFLGFKILKKNLRVLYIDTECGEQIMHNRYKALIENFKPWVGGDRFIMISMEGDSGNLWDDIDEAVSIFKPDYVCVDCLYNVNQWGGDLGKAPDMSKITNALQQIRSRHNTTVEAIAHFVKGNSERGLDMNRIAGSAVLQNWVQHCLCIINVPADKNLRFMQITKARTSDFPRDVFALEWHPKEQWLSKRAIVADPIKYLMSQDKIDKMYALITNVKERADKDGFFATEMALNAGAELEISRATVHRQLTSAVTAGLITDEGHGKWRLTGLRTIEFDKYESDEEDDSE